MESKRTEDAVLVNADAASRGARMAMSDNRDAAETKARERLAGDRNADRFMLWGATMLDHRGKHPRPACTYRGARRNAARFIGWPQRRRFRKEPRFT